MVIQRESYLNALKIRMHNGMIKVVTGIRRSGKSFLIFNIFKKYLLEKGYTSVNAYLHDLIKADMTAAE